MSRVEALRRDRDLRRLTAWTGPLWLWGLVILAIFVAIYTVPDFARSTNYQNLASQAIPLAIVTLGQTFVILTRGIDISVAPMISMGNTLAMYFMDGNAGSIWLAILLPILAGAALGSISGLVVAKLKAPPFIVTLGMASIVQGLVFWYTDYGNIGAPADSVTEFGFKTWVGIPAVAVTFIPLLIACLVVQNRTAAGRHLYAVGGDEVAARRAGVHVDRVKVAAYAASGALAALAGVVLATRTGAGEPLTGNGYDWDSVAAVVIGGTSLLGGKGGVAGSMLAVAIVGIVNNCMNLLNVSSFYQVAVKGGVILLAVAVAAMALRGSGVGDRLRERWAGLRARHGEAAT